MAIDNINTEFRNVAENTPPYTEAEKQALETAAKTSLSNEQIDNYANDTIYRFRVMLKENPNLMNPPKFSYLEECQSVAKALQRDYGHLTDGDSEAIGRRLRERLAELKENPGNLESQEIQNLEEITIETPAAIRIQTQEAGASPPNYPDTIYRAPSINNPDM